MANKPILKRPSPDKIREAVVLIAGGRRSAAEMAPVVGCSERTLERALKAYRDGLAKAPPAAPAAAPVDPPPPSPTASQGDDEIARARRAAGLEPKAPDVPPVITKTEVDLAARADRKRREDYCVDQVRQAKGRRRPDRHRRRIELALLAVLGLVGALIRPTQPEVQGQFGSGPPIVLEVQRILPPTRKPIGQHLGEIC